MLPFLVLVILVCGTSASEHEQKRMFPIPPIYPPIHPPYYNMIATGAFNYATEKCCLGNISPANRYSQCCGNQIYDTTRQICCLNEVRKRKIGYACCGKDTFNTEKEFCCNENNIVSMPGTINAYIECCGNKTFDSSKQICCSANGKPEIVYSKSPNSDGCCGDKAMNVQTEICCVDNKVNPAKYSVLEKKTRNEICCNNKVIDYDRQTYNTKEEICCGIKPNVFEKNRPDQSPHLACCGDKAYSMNTEGCCSNYKDQYAVYKINKESCCGYKVYKENGICCNDENGRQIFQETNSTSSSCCGSKSYSYLTQICCGDNVYNQSESKTCCGNKLYDLNTQTCCKTYDSTTGTYTGKVLDQKEVGKTCCGFSKLISYTDGELCCGDQVYDTWKQICCGNKLFDSNGQKTSCCGDQVYGSMKQICCGNKLFDSNGQKTSCCGDQMYDTKKQICCGNKLFDSDGQKTSCCYANTTVI